MTGRPLDAGRLGRWELALLLVTVGAVEDGTAIDHWLALRVGISGWVSVLLAVAPVLLGTWGLGALADRMPGRDLAGLLQAAFGPLAYPLTIGYAALFLADATLSVREYGDLSRLLGFMNLTPYAVFAAALVAVAAYGAWLGLEVVARINAAVLLFLDLPFGLLLVALSANHQRLARLLPLLVHGWGPALWGTWLVVGKFGEFVLALVFLPLVARGRQRAGRALIWSVPLITVMALGHITGPVLTFGPFVQRLEWPAYFQVRAIEVARFIENVDWITIVVWTHGFLIETATFTYAASILLARVLGLARHRALLPWLFAAVLAASFFAGRTEEATLYERWLLDAYGFVACGWILPLFCLAVLALRGRRRAEPPAEVAESEAVF